MVRERPSRLPDERLEALAERQLRVRGRDDSLGLELYRYRVQQRLILITKRRQVPLRVKESRHHQVAILSQAGTGRLIYCRHKSSSDGSHMCRRSDYVTARPRIYGRTIPEVIASCHDGCSRSSRSSSPSV